MLEEELMAAVLVGGLGTRLRPITEKVPKPLVEVRGKPFLHYVLSDIRRMGIKKVVLLSGYKHEMIEKFAGDGAEWGLSIEYSVESEQLGTGGALFHARGKLDRTVLVMNGDSFLELDLGAFMAHHKKYGGLATIFSMKGPLEARGALKVRDHRVEEFLEKQKGGMGIFNTGAYLMEPSGMRFIEGKIREGNLGRKFSMEADCFPLMVQAKALFAYVGAGTFLDMGTFESLAAAHKVVP